MARKKKQKAKYQKAAKRKKGDLDKSIVFENGQPCGDGRCQTSRMRKCCGSCGRINARGKCIVTIRKGPVHLERLTPIHIKEYAGLSPAKQKKHTLKIWLHPSESLTDFKVEKD